jgi:hypothetical protein
MLDKPLLMTLSSLNAPLKWNTFYAVGHAALGYAVASLVKVYFDRAFANLEEPFKTIQKQPVKYVACVAATIASGSLLYFTAPMKLSRNQFLCLFLANAFIGSGSFFSKRYWGKMLIVPLVICTSSTVGAAVGYLGRPVLLVCGLAGASLGV